MRTHLRVSSLAWRLVLTGVLVALTACSKPEPAPEPVRAVKVMTIGVSGIEARYEFAGEVRARVESRLGFRVAGKLLKRQVELGQRVKAGQVLAQLDPRDYQLAADAARAQVASAQSNLDLALADFKRYQTLKEQNFISSAELERRQTSVDVARAQLNQTKAQLSSQGNQTTYATLVADVSGIVTSVDAEPGQVVSAGSPVVRIAQDGARDVLFSVPEDKVASITSGSAVSIRPWSDDTLLQGKVREVAASADPVTRTYLVKVALDDKDQLPLGSTVYVVPKALSQVGAPVIKLPTSALRQDGKATAVWVLDTATMTVKSQTIQVALVDGNDVVVASGLQPGMQIVSAGVHVLSPGQKVSIYQSPLSASNAAGAQAAQAGNPAPAASVAR